MKLKHIFIMSVALCTLSACSLEEDSSSFATSANFYKNAQQCRAALNTCYIPMKSMYSYKMMLATECVTDLAYSRSSTQDAQLDISLKPIRVSVPMSGSRAIWACAIATEP